jgi:VWFA-related protein
VEVLKSYVSVFAAVLFAAAPTVSQTQAPAPPQFRSGVDIVHLDVSVLGRDRRPVRGLTPSDFVIFENGRERLIAVFSAVDIPEAAPPTAPWMRDVAPDVGSNDGIDERRLFLIIIDDSAIQADPFSMKNVKEIGRKVIDRLGPSDLAAVVFTRDNRNAQDFTEDRARLLAAVDKYTVGFRDMAHPAVAGADDLYLMYSVNVLQSAVDAFSALPDRRKSIVYIGQGVPVDLEGAAAPASPGLPEAGGASALSQQGLNSRFRTQMANVFEQATRANVNVYPIDVCGLRIPPGPRPQPKCPPGPEVEYLRTLAGNTGGRAIVDTNDFESGVAAIFEENSSYYLLGFQPADAAQDGKFRRISVGVNRPDLLVRTRSGYQADKPDAAKRKAALAASPLGVALSGVLPKSDLPLRLAAVPLALPGRRESAVAIVVGVRQPIRQMADRNVEKVDLQVSAFNVEGRSFGSTRMRADVAIRAGASGLAEYEVFSRLDLKPGRYQLRIAAHVGSLSTTGSLYYDVDVPDVTSMPVTLSPMVLTATPGPIVASRGELKGILPVVPTTRRTFAATDQVAAFARIYQGGKSPLAPLDLLVQLRNQENVLVMDRTQRMAADRFTSNRSADVRIEVPIARLPAGAYVLTINSGSATARASRFEIAR